MRTILALLVFLTVPALARDDGRYANSPLKGWFESLRSQKGYCCAEADGRETGIRHARQTGIGSR